MKLLVAVVVVAGACASAPARGPTLFVIGTELVRLDRVHHEGALPLYELSLVRSNTPFCEPDARGERWAMSVVDTEHQVHFVCSSGAIGKCIRWGYPPGNRLHDACVRMVRADYGGDGRSHTREGTRIAFCDLDGVHPCTPTDVAIEAAWTATGAACVARPRVPSLVSLGELAQRYPRLVGHLGDACTVRSAATDPDVRLFSAVPPGP